MLPLAHNPALNRWHASRIHHEPGPRAWVVQKLFLGTHHIVHKKGSGRERRFNTRLKAEDFAKRLNAR